MQLHNKRQPDLETQFEPKLELTGIERRSWAAEIAAVTSAQLKCIHVVNEGRGRCFIETVKEVEALGNQFKPGAFTQANCAAESQIELHEAVGDASVATKAAARENAIGNQGDTACCAGHAQRAVRQDGWSVRLVRLIIVCILVGQNIKRPAGRHFEDGSEGEV